jgi:hypothetical protein
VIGPVVFGSNVVCGGSVTSNCFTTPDPGSSGSGRNLFEAPGYWNMDLSVIKRFAITERVALQFRTEAFNVFNHANFDNPRDASSSSTAINSTLLGQSCCATVAPSSTQSIVQTGESARVVQFALKLDF